MLKNILSAVLCVALLTGCKHEVPAGNMPTGYIALTFDDSDADGWYKYLPLLDSLGIKATFYISNYSRLTKEQIYKLHKIENKGHEIAFHSSTHPDFVKTSRVKGLDHIINFEIKEGLEKMRRDGFNPVNFAYPYGRHTQQLHGNLLPFFKSLRVTSNKKNYLNCLVQKKGRNQILYGCPVDQNSFINDQQIKSLIRNAAEKKLCALLYAHEIERTSYPYHISTKRIRMIATAAKEDNVRFVTVKEITE